MGSELLFDWEERWGQAVATKLRWAILGWAGLASAAAGQQGVTLQAPPYGMC